LKQLLAPARVAGWDAGREHAPGNERDGHHAKLEH
jgi:hypothetical protein